ncbi:MAG: hypothetical protein GYA16_13465 [Spirochaetes bacterium]|nr:hypothetical protein [Spirochaetota bacterium]
MIIKYVEDFFGIKYFEKIAILNNHSYDIFIQNEINSKSIIGYRMIGFFKENEISYSGILEKDEKCKESKKIIEQIKLIGIKE